MTCISTEEFRASPLDMLQRVEQGERLIVLRDGRPVAELRPVLSAPPNARPFGLAAGDFSVPADFDAPLPEAVLQGYLQLL